MFGGDGDIPQPIPGETQNLTSGGRGRKSRRRKGRGSGRGGYLMDVAVATGLLGATQLSKGRVGYGFRGRNGYYRSTKRRSSRKSRKSRRSGSRR